MRFLVDGYNVTKRDPATRASALEEQRASLAARLRVRGADLLGAGEIVVVFDGQPGVGRETGAGAVQVRFSRGESADELIVRMADATTAVITSDEELASRVRVRGATVLPAESCFEGRRPKRRSGRYPASTVGLPKGANEITREMKKLWLDDEE